MGLDLMNCKWKIVADIDLSHFSFTPAASCEPWKLVLRASWTSWAKCHGEWDGCSEEGKLCEITLTSFFYQQTLLCQKETGVILPTGISLFSLHSTVPSGIMSMKLLCPWHKLYRNHSGCRVNVGKVHFCMVRRIYNFKRMTQWKAKGYDKPAPDKWFCENVWATVFHWG